MDKATIISTWIEDPQWADGWRIAHGSSLFPRPSLWLVQPAHAHTTLADRYVHTLSKDELIRAGRFHQPAHQVRYKTTHTVLRMLLANATHTNAAGLRFAAGRHHKPDLVNDGRHSISFNLSYTENRSLIGISDGAAIGVDIEWLRRPIVIDDMLGACFSDKEINYITSTPNGIYQRFFTLWTRKEAILKLTGEGIGEHLPFFDVLDGTCVARKEIIGGNPPDTIYLYSFRISDGYVGCYAASGPVDKLQFYQL